MNITNESFEIAAILEWNVRNTNCDLMKKYAHRNWDEFKWLFRWSSSRKIAYRNYWTSHPWNDFLFEMTRNYTANVCNYILFPIFFEVNVLFFLYSNWIEASAPFLAHNQSASEKWITWMMRLLLLLFFFSLIRWHVNVMVLQFGPFAPNKCHSIICITRSSWMYRCGESWCGIVCIFVLFL